MVQWAASEGAAVTVELVGVPVVGARRVCSAVPAVTLEQPTTSADKAMTRAIRMPIRVAGTHRTARQVFGEHPAAPRSM